MFSLHGDTMAELKNIRIAVSGLYDYALEEIPTLRLPMPGNGAPEWVEEKRLYQVYRPAPVLAVACPKFANLPLTHHHPKAPVDGQNFRDIAIGWTGEHPEVDYIAETNEVGIRSTCVLYDDEALSAYENGEVQLSPGYIAVFEWQKGTTPDGKEYDIIMKEITDVNHLALLPNGRGGEYATVLDNAPKTETVFDLVKTKDSAPKVKTVFDIARERAGMTVFELVRITEDERRTYKPGEISENTGLQKQEDGSWAQPKGAVATEKNEIEKKDIEKIRYEKLRNFKAEDINKNAEKMLFDLGELNSLAVKGYGRTNTQISNEIYSVKNETIPKLAEALQKKGYSVKIGDDYLNYDNKTNNVIYFEKDGVQVSFHGDFKEFSEKYPKADENEWNGLYNSWKYKTKEEQEKAKEKQDVIVKENQEKLDLYTDKAKNELKKIAKRKGIELTEEDFKGLHVGVMSAGDVYNPYERKKLIDQKKVVVYLPYSQKIKSMHSNYNERKELEGKINKKIQE